MNYGLNIINYLKSQNYRVKDFNIVYLEGCNPDTFELNADRLDEWNDVRMVITGEGDIKLCATATTEPGRYYTNNPLNPNGAARIAFGQYLDAWTFGIHGKSRQDALVQCGVIKVHRDLNKDGFRTNDRVYEGDGFGINQHTTSNAPDTINFWSAGCCVGKYPATHAKFMQLCRESGYKKFDTTILDAGELKKLGVI